MRTVDRSLEFESAEDIFESYMSLAPLAHALFRTSEAEHIRQVALEPPVLDLGCGAGQFARAALAGTVDVGVDVSASELARARASGRYRRCELADACRLPFGDGQFRSVLSVSVLEHLADPAPALAEAARVLEPGGVFAGTLGLIDLHDHLFYPRLFRRLGASALARSYLRAQDWMFGHRSLLPRESWEQLLTGAGFDLVVSKKIVPPRLTWWWDLLLPGALPALLWQRLGCSRFWKPRWSRALARSIWRSARSAEGEAGSVLFVVARKGTGETCPAEVGSDKLVGACAVEGSSYGWG